MPTLSIIVPTCGRPTLRRALDSAVPQLSDDDELLVVGDGPQPAAREIVAACAAAFGGNGVWEPTQSTIPPKALPPADESNDRRLRYFEHGPTNYYGNAQRNHGMAQARRELIAFLDDDDELCRGALAAIRRAAAEYPGRPLMFRLACDRPKFVIWRTPKVAVGNVSGGAFVVPNRPDRLVPWPAQDPQSPARRNDCSDFAFIAQTLALHPPDALVWRKEIIYHVHRRSYNAS